MNEPGHVLAVIRAGEVQRVDAAGVANAETGEPLTAGSIFYVGSLAKQFVAACVALLERDGALRADDPVGGFLPELPAWGGRVTLAHLLHHTSGLPPPPYFLDGLSVAGVPAYGSADRLARVMEIETLEREPGTSYAYTNHGYTLLSEVVGRASGTSLAAFAQERMFAPLGMRHTRFRDAPRELPAAAARGHFEATDGAIHVEPARFHAVGAGGLWTTVADLASWDAAFYDDRSVASRLTTRGVLADGTPIHYAWGLSVRTHRGRPIHSHGGSFPGWASKMVRFPEQRTTIVVLANHERLDVSALAFATADEVLAGSLDPDASHADATFDGAA
ncbi:MAG: serine hydrolase domain-containing protein [Actinomycetota bacterium]